MVSAIRVHQLGGPEVLKYEEIDLPEPGPGQVRYRTTAVGVNYIDTYFRTGLYPAPGLPFTVGNESAGIITAVGKGVKGLKKGDRVAYAGSAPGAYCEERNVPAEILVKVPKGISDRDAAAMMLKGMTAEDLVRRTYKCKKGDVVLFHAAAGGVGMIFGQWAKALGVKAIGTVSSPEKAALAKKNGYTWVIDYSKEDVAARVKEITKG